MRTHKNKEKDRNNQRQTKEKTVTDKLQYSEIVKEG